MMNSEYMGTNKPMLSKDNVTKNFNYLLNIISNFNLLTRIIIISVSIIVSEKFIKEKILKIMIHIKNANSSNFDFKFLKAIFKELWYLPFVLFIYNIIMMCLIYIFYLFIWVLFIGKTTNNMGMNFQDPNIKSLLKTYIKYLYGRNILIEIFKTLGILLFINIITIIVIFILVILLSNNDKMNDNNIQIEFINYFISYYKYILYFFVIIINIYFTYKSDINKILNNVQDSDKN
jgi:hypothetical protein